MRKRFLWVFTWLLTVVLIAGCSMAAAGKPPFQKEGEKVSNEIADQLVGAVPYPVASMKDSLERRDLRERLLRFNRPDKVGYVYITSLTGQPVGYYVIKGKVSSTQSQMTNPQQTWNEDCGNACGNIGNVDSIGDDGSYGPEEGGPAGVFFYTTNGVLVETTMPWIYSDSPLPLHAPKLNPAKAQADISDR